MPPRIRIKAQTLKPRRRSPSCGGGSAKIVSGKVVSAADQPPQTASSCISPLTVLGQSLNDPSRRQAETCDLHHPTLAKVTA